MTLAILGFPPSFSQQLHVGRPNVMNREQFLLRVNDILDRKWLTNDGPYVQEFEMMLADLIGVKHCVAICNGTVALEIAIRATELKGEVIVPAFTFVATAHALEWLGIRPVFCDINPNTYTIDPSRIEDLITPHTTGIIGVHLWGRACDVTSLSEIARAHRLNLMFDAAHALACSHSGTMIGGFGDAEMFSFHATKFVNAFEGGAIATNNGELAERMRRLRNFGFSGYDKVDSVGTNGKMSEVSAAMGLTMLESSDEIIENNRRNYDAYKSGLVGIPGITLLEYDTKEVSNYQYIVIKVDHDLAPLGRDDLMRALWAENVLARRYFYPGCHRMQPYVEREPPDGLPLQFTESASMQTLALPTGSSISLEDIDIICGLIGAVASNADHVRLALSLQMQNTAALTHPA